MEAGFLISYFARKNEARGAIRNLRKRHFRHTALVHKTAEGAIHTWAPFFWCRALGVTLAATLSGAFAGVASLVFKWPQSLPVEIYTFRQ